MHHPELNHKVHTWPKSDEFCREFGDNSRMVEVHTEQQKAFLSQLVGGEGYYYHWTGATDKGHEGDWIWASTGGSNEPVQDFVWAPSELL